MFYSIRTMLINKNDCNYTKQYKYKIDIFNKK